MLVEINLLPQKEPKKISFIITMASLVVVLLIFGSYYIWQINTAKDEVSSIDRQIKVTKQVAAKAALSNGTADSSNSVNQLKSAITWAKEYPIQTIPVMEKLSALLPERGFIQSFGYTEAGTITLTVQFDSAREAAYFLENMNEAKWIAEANLSSLTTSAAPTGTQSTTSNSTSTVNTTAAGSSLNGSTMAGTADTATDKNILPRYTGQFELKLNKQALKENSTKSIAAGEGVSGS